MLYQGSQNEIRRTKVAGPKTRSLRSRAFTVAASFRHAWAAGAAGPAA